MCLKLHLLGGDAITKLDDKEYLIFNNKKTRQNFKLSEDQNKVFREMLKKNEEFRVHLLQGTTGSGKTIVYFKQIEEILKKGYQAIILLPEIGLTSEFEKKFEEFFGFKAAIWHSGVTPKRKKIIWSGVASGLIKVVIGARSSLFLPEILISSPWIWACILSFDFLTNAVIFLASSRSIPLFNKTFCEALKLEVSIS